MTALRLQIGVVSFAGLASAALVNIFYLQPVPPVRGVPLDTDKTAVQAAVMRPLEASRGASPAAAATAETIYGVQRELASRGYTTGPADGRAPQVLQAAIMAYEFDQGLSLTGEPNDVLLRTIILGPASADVAPIGTAKAGPVAQQIIASVQQTMTKLGYGPIKADGVPSEAMVAAIKRFEREQGLRETGRISGDLVLKMDALAALGARPMKR